VKIGFVLPDLARLDQLRCDVLAVSFFEEERPLRGAAGLVDWRMCGRLSRLMTSEKLRGGPSELMLLPPRPRLPFDKLLILGLGARAAFDESVYADALRRTFTALKALRTHSVALALPGRSTDAIDAERAAQCLLDLLPEAEDQDELVLVEDQEGQKRMGPVLAKR
jgi:hypothetical protein